MVKKIDDKMFWAVKALTDAGSTIPEIAKYLQIGAASVSRIRAAENPEDYRRQIAAAALEAKRKAEAKRKPAPAPEKPVEALEKPVETHVVHQTDMRTLELLKEQNALLKLISNKLVFIVEQLA